MYTQWKKLILRRSYSLIKSLPRSLRDPILRSQIHISYDYIHGLEIKIAETKEEFEEAYRLLHDTYSDTKLIESDSTGLRITKYHSLPTTSVIVVKHDNKVIGTMTVIQDNPLGLPIDHVTDISELRKSREKIAEISSLAISKKSNFRKGKIYLPLTQYLHRYCDQIGVDSMVCVVNENAKLFYESILLFKELPVNCSEYSYVKADEICPIELTIGEQYKQKLKKIYGNKKPNKNLYIKRYVAPPDAFMKLPESKYFLGAKNQLSKKNMQYFFKDKSNIFHDLDTKESFHLHSTYISKELRAMLPETDISNLNRKNIRFPVNFKARLINLNSGELHTANILESSVEGFGIRTKAKLKVGDQCRWEIQVNKEEKITLNAEVCWQSEQKNSIGIRIKEPIPSEWIKLHLSLLEDFYPDINAMEIISNINPQLQVAA